MDIVDIIVKIIGFAIIALGVVLIYDARNISEKRFSFEDKNTGIRIMKITGFGISLIGGLILIINICK